jgi:hypothetical protein
MSIKFEKIRYQELNGRQQETYNFQKVSAVLADFGYLTIRLTDDWNGADFIAQHFQTKEFLKVQLKGRLCFYKKYCQKDLYICFNDSGTWYFYPHDEVLRLVLELGLLVGTESWDVHSGYSFPGIPSHLKDILAPYRLTA